MGGGSTEVMNPPCCGLFPTDCHFGGEEGLPQVAVTVKKDQVGQLPTASSGSPSATGTVYGARLQLHRGAQRVPHPRQQQRRRNLQQTPVGASLLFPVWLPRQVARAALRSGGFQEYTISQP